MYKRIYNKMDKRNQKNQKMDQKSAIEIVKRYLDYLKTNKIKVQKTYIFGSFAKNKNRDDSDIDIALIINNMSNSFLMQVELMKLGRKIDSRLEPHPFDASDFNDSNPFAYEILKNGISVL